MKKILSCLMAMLLTASLFSACGTDGEIEETASVGQETPAPEKLKIVATTFPQYDWVREILGDHIENAELTLLLDDGVDLHSFQPTVEDIAKISACDMFIYVGGESDAWVQDALKTAESEDMAVISLVEALGDIVKEEEIVEGMEHDHEHAHGEIDPENVFDRPLSDWAGEWETIETALKEGALDGYIVHESEESETSAETLKETYAERWKSDYKTLGISEGSIVFDGAAADYEYLGYKIVESDHGVSVWYGFGAAAPAEGIPAYIAFSDHAAGSDHEDEHDEEDDHDDGDEHDEEDEHGHAAHFHMRYGNESFDALVNIEDWSPTFFEAGASGEEIAEAMSEHGGEDEHELDEHVWLSLKNAQFICAALAEELSALDPENAADYRKNAEAYDKKLADLDAEYEAAVADASYKTLLFADRFPFRYLVDDYGLQYYAAFSGCSAETEASFETIAFLSGKLGELELGSVMVIETSDQSIARTVIGNSGADREILVMDSMQSVTAADVSAGYTYLAAMEKNLEALKGALK